MPPAETAEADVEVLARRVLERAKYRCERCGKPNRKEVLVAPNGAWIESHPERFCEDPWRDVTGKALDVDPDPPERGSYRKAWVSIGVRRVGGTPDDGIPENLQALCQHCRGRHDAQQRALRTEPKRRRSASLDLGDLLCDGWKEDG